MTIIYLCKHGVKPGEFCPDCTTLVATIEPHFKCKAQRTADPPQDCDWPTCGCDPYANKVIEALVELGKLR